MINTCSTLQTRVYVTLTDKKTIAPRKNRRKTAVCLVIENTTKISKHRGSVTRTDKKTVAPRKSRRKAVVCRVIENITKIPYKIFFSMLLMSQSFCFITIFEFILLQCDLSM